MEQGRRLGVSMARAEDQDRERALERARDLLGEAGVRRALEGGQGLSLDEAVVEALDEAAP
jgi:hypothetical protein